MSDTEYLLLSWPSQIIVRWFSKDILAKHPLTEVVRSLGLQNINFTLYHHNIKTKFSVFGTFVSSEGALIAIAPIGQDDDNMLRMMMMLKMMKMKLKLTFVFVFGAFQNDDDGGIEMKLMMVKMLTI